MSTTPMTTTDWVEWPGRTAGERQFQDENPVAEVSASHAERERNLPYRSDSRNPGKVEKAPKQNTLFLITKTQFI